ncbi:hypothetical protein J7J00_02145 [Bacillus sp. ISL-4]|uniref:hypothetical protein n=1 Tax=Bacillus sp. ISL-4 TaxID=2819125 RepID=UPI001BED3AE6|nr:hypothetical protein [Bacillus sp. ISL-4]MBT2664305.1 hypothetical protein [Bacillus sp. ISL-4]
MVIHYGSAGCTNASTASNYLKKEKLELLSKILTGEGKVRWVTVNVVYLARQPVKKSVDDWYDFV